MSNIENLLAQKDLQTINTLSARVRSNVLIKLGKH